MKNMSYSFVGKLFLATLLLIGSFLFIHHPADAASTVSDVQVVSVEYYDNNIVVLNNGNTKIYFATDTEAASGKWDVIDADPGNYTVIDTSWLSPSDLNVVMIKGDIEDTASRIVLVEKPSKLDVNINYSNMSKLDPTDDISTLLNIMTTEGTSDDPITYSDLEWKKGESGQWKSTEKLTVSMLDKFMVKGVSLIFRIRAVDDCVIMKDGTTFIDFNQRRIDGLGGIADYVPVSATVDYGDDYPDGTDGRRFSSEAKVKISKKTTPVVNGVDGEDFKVSIKYGKEYKVTVTYADNSTGLNKDWIKVTDRATKTISLSDLANGVKLDDGSAPDSVDGITKAYPQMSIQIRDFATAKKAASKITEISLDAQRTLTEDIQLGLPDLTKNQTENDVYVYYYGNKYILLTIPEASTELPYEYCIVKPGETFNLARASWSSVTKGTGVKILANKALQDGKLYVRQKEIRSKAESDTTSAIAYQLASTCVSLDLDYPSIPIATKQNLTYVKTYTTIPLTITVQLNESEKVAFEDTVKSIKLGTKDIGFDTDTVKSADGKISIMTITLKSSDLELMTNCTNRIVTITYEKGTVDKASIKLTIKNPTNAGSLTLSAVAGTTAGSTKVSVVNILGTDNKWVYVIGDTEVANVKEDDILPTTVGTAFTSGLEIPITAGKYLTVYEINETGNIMKWKSIQVTAGMIK